MQCNLKEQKKNVDSCVDLPRNKTSEPIKVTESL